MIMLFAAGEMIAQLIALSATSNAAVGDQAVESVPLRWMLSKWQSFGYSPLRLYDDNILL